MTGMSSPAASLIGISKRFGATLALDSVDFDLRYGEIHAVVGENGAGKSTLIRILGGVHRPDRGTIRIDSTERHFANPRDAIAAGVVTIPQELRLVPALSIAENIALGDLPVRRVGPLAMVDRAASDEAQQAFALLPVQRRGECRSCRLRMHVHQKYPSCFFRSIDVAPSWSMTRPRRSECRLSSVSWMISATERAVLSMAPVSG